MPLNITEENDSPFFMYDADDATPPDHMKTQTQRTLFYRAAIEAFDLVETSDDLFAWQLEYMEDMKYMGNYKYKEIQKMVADRRLLLADCLPF